MEIDSVEHIVAVYLRDDELKTLEALTNEQGGEAVLNALGEYMFLKVKDNRWKTRFSGAIRPILRREQFPDTAGGGEDVTPDDE